MRLPTRVFGWLWRKIISKIYIESIKGRSSVWGCGVVIYGFPVISMESESRLIVGDRVVLCSSSFFTALGVRQKVNIKLLSNGALVRIGSDVGISGASICAYGNVSIGDGSLIGAGVVICDTDFHPIASFDRRYKSISDAGHADVVVGKNVFIGAESIILKGVEIGDNSVIGAGSVVTKSVPSNVIFAGNPARLVRNI